jgi:hypothetical protein
LTENPYEVMNALGVRFPSQDHANMAGQLTTRHELAVDLTKLACRRDCKKLVWDWASSSYLSDQTIPTQCVVIASVGRQRVAQTSAVRHLRLLHHPLETFWIVRIPATDDQRIVVDLCCHERLA